MRGQNNDKNRLKRVSFRIPSNLLNDLEQKAQKRGYKDRSEALREAARKFVRDTNRKEVKA